jgi:hypothetical protein
LWLIGVCSAVVLLVVLVAMVMLSIAALGSPRDRAAADETLRRAAGRLGGRFAVPASTPPASVKT